MDIEGPRARQYNQAKAQTSEHSEPMRQVRTGRVGSAERMKMRKQHHVPLSDGAIKLLGELGEVTGWGELLFPSQSSSKKPISENTFNQALRRMGFGPDQVTSHGFRATFSTLANESGLWHPDAIERAIAHVEKNEVRRAYDRGIHWEQRVKMADWWANLITGLQSS